MQWRRARWSTRLFSAILIGGLAWCGWRCLVVRQYRSAMAEIDDAMRHGRYTAAARDLTALLAWSPNSDRAMYLRGVCEKARGQTGQAEAAWAAVPRDSVYSKRALAGRMDLLVERGQLADAENLILRATDNLGLEESALRMILIPLFVQEGRAGDALRLIESRWQILDASGEGDVEQAVNLARLHMELRSNVPPADSIGEYLGRLSRLAPDDDRIWLGRANLAIRAGACDQARRWIDDCLERHPEDQAVWRASLDWSVRTNHLAEVRIALAHLPSALATSAEIYRVSAWIASRSGDVECERHELSALVAEDPEDFEALERLEHLEAQRPPKTAAASPWRPRAEVERDQARYRELYARNQPARDALEMARLAQSLGQRFEAILFLSAALADEPNRADLRESRLSLERVAHELDEPNQTLFDLVANACQRHDP